MEQRQITRDMVAETILKGEHSPDTDGGRGLPPRPGAYDYRYRMEIRGKWRIMKVVHDPDEHLVLHVHYYNAR